MLSETEVVEYTEDTEITSFEVFQNGDVKVNKVLNVYRNGTKITTKKFETVLSIDDSLLEETIPADCFCRSAVEDVWKVANTRKIISSRILKEQEETAHEDYPPHMRRRMLQETKTK